MENIIENTDNKYITIRDIAKKVRILMSYNNINFNDETIFRDIRDKLSEIYPELVLPETTQIGEFNKLLDIVLQKEGLCIGQ
jgi:acetone carboxylase gamma subunit